MRVYPKDNLAEKCAAERKATIRRAKDQIDTLRAMESMLEQTGLARLLDHFPAWLNNYAFGASIRFEAKDTQRDDNGHRQIDKDIVVPIAVTGTDIDWKIAWGADVKIVDQRQRIVRSCQWTAKVNDILVQIDFNADLESPIILSEGDMLPSGCVIGVSVQAQTTSKAVTCKYQ